MTFPGGKWLFHWTEKMLFCIPNNAQQKFFIKNSRKAELFVTPQARGLSRWILSQQMFIWGGAEVFKTSCAIKYRHTGYSRLRIRMFSCSWIAKNVVSTTASPLLLHNSVVVELSLDSEKRVSMAPHLEQF